MSDIWPAADVAAVRLRCRVAGASEASTRLFLADLARRVPRLRAYVDNIPDDDLKATLHRLEDKAVERAASAQAAARYATAARSERELARGLRRPRVRWQPRVDSGQPHYNT